MERRQSHRARTRTAVVRLRAAFGQVAGTLITLFGLLRHLPEPVQSGDRYIRFLRSSQIRGGSNLVFASRLSNEEFNRRLQRSTYWDWIQSADYHYFISRALFLRQVGEYSLLAGRQCVENYLKAYLRYRRLQPPRIHDLAQLLERCRAVAPIRHLFIHSDQAAVVIDRYDPFYEVARYPVPSVIPGSGSYALFYPDDIVVLDYFVYRMREIMHPPPNASWDILVNGSYHLYMTQDHYPDFYQLLHQGNLNFGHSFPRSHSSAA